MTTLVGFSEKKGTSKKTGREYHFYVLYVVDDNPHPMKNIFGDECYSVNWSGNGSDTSDYLQAITDCPVNIVYDRDGAVLSVEEVK